MPQTFTAVRVFLAIFREHPINHAEDNLGDPADHEQVKVNRPRSSGVISESRARKGEVGQGRQKQKGRGRRNRDKRKRGREKQVRWGRKGGASGKKKQGELIKRVNPFEVKRS